MTAAKQNFAPIIALGLMSGTSLDGLDLALCRFEMTDGKWSFETMSTKFIPYDETWKNILVTAYDLPIESLQPLHREYGDWLGQQVNLYLKDRNKPDLICSHGHTVKHDPGAGITFQLGDGKTIATKTRTTTISDFRSKDVRLGGQGAPLVPIGDQLLFNGYDACLNLGGFSNISFEKNGIRSAFDISPVNIVFNELAQKLGHSFDRDGGIARSGKIDEELLQQLMQASSDIRLNRPSLSREWVERSVVPLLNSSIATKDQMATLTEYAAQMIAEVLIKNELKNLLITGGGAYNSYLIERISKLASITINQASSELIEFKEAMIFAFLGVLRYHGLINVLSSVTGATEDSVSGEIFSA